MTDLVCRLRAAGCVFAEDEAAALIRAESDPLRREELVRRRERGEPLEHVLGMVEFGGLRLSVGPGVFVPRQRSLLLAQLAVERSARQDRAVLLEMCCGVAPLAATVAESVHGVELHASDVDRAALRHARLNLPVGAAIHEGDLAVPGALHGRVTLLVATPPYVPTSAAALLPHEAREHEPGRALYGGPDGLDCVRRLLDAAPPWLAPGGRLLVELSARQQESALAYAQRGGWRQLACHSQDRQTVVLELALEHARPWSGTGCRR